MIALIDHLQQPQRRAVHEIDPPPFGQADDARGHRTQHRIKKSAPCLGRVVLLDHRVALPFELAGHLVEKLPQHRDLIIAAIIGDAHIQIALAHALRGTGQLPHRARQPLGKPQAKPDRGQHHDDRKAQIQQAKLEQHPATLGFKLAVKPHGLLRFIQQREDFAIHLAADVKIAIRIGIKAEKRTKLVLQAILDQHQLAIVGARDIGRIGTFEIEQIARFAARPDIAQPVDDKGLFQATLDAALALAQDLAQIAIGLQQRGAPVKVQEIGQRHGIGRQIIAVLLAIGDSRIHRIAQGARNAVRKPALKPHVHGDRGKNGHKDRRHQRHDGEHAGQPQMQPRAR